VTTTNFNSSTENSQPIDVVIAWVDGNDPRLKEKRERFIKGAPPIKFSGASATRFASTNEIRYCVLSILKFAPFVRNIFIVTDEQDPNIYEEVRKYFPERLNAIRIVDHKEIFRGHEEYLPTFNSISIGNMVWRIEGLSENFVYFNDDVFLIRDIKPSDWIIENRPVLRGRWVLPPYLKIFRNRIRVFINRELLNNPGYHPKFSFHLVQWNAASLLGMKFRLFFNCHTPHVVNRKRVEDFYTKNNSLLEKNISYRFRDQAQFNVTTLANHMEILSGNRNTEKLNLGYLVPSYYSKRRLNKKMRRCETHPGVKSVCVQSLDTASKEDQDKIFNWMDRILNLQDFR
jgi:hypothetical protein